MGLVGPFFFWQVRCVGMVVLFMIMPPMVVLLMIVPLMIVALVIVQVRCVTRCAARGGG